MSGFLLDTNIVKKRNATNGENIRRWLATVDDSSLRLSAITVFEISKGIQKKRDEGNAALADTLADSLRTLMEAFGDRILNVDASIAEVWGRLAGPELKQWMDRGLIATAKVQGLVLVSCNSKDMKGRGVEVINPDRNTIGRWGPEGDALPIGAVGAVATR